MSSWTSLEVTNIGGLQITTASRDELACAAIDDCVSAKNRDSGPVRPRLVFDANGHGISLSASCARFNSLMSKAHIVHADGGFIVSLSRWIGRKPIKERSATTDLIHDIAKKAEASQISFYLLGGSEVVNAECERRLRLLYPKLNIAGRRNGYFSDSEEESVVSHINDSGADILWVGLGKPLEQDFCVRNLCRLRATWVITCGGCFNYITGAYRRAPGWMRVANLEWFHRMLTGPKGLFFRYLTTSPHAIWVVLKYAIYCSAAFGQQDASVDHQRGDGAVEGAKHNND